MYLGKLVIQHSPRTVGNLRKPAGHPGLHCRLRPLGTADLSRTSGCPDRCCAGSWRGNGLAVGLSVRNLVRASLLDDRPDSRVLSGLRAIEVAGALDRPPDRPA